MSVREELALEYLRIQESDIPELLAADQEGYPDPWTQGMFRQEIINPVSEFFVVRNDGNLVAYVGFWMALDEAHITKVTVLPAYRQRGIGREVLEWLLRRAEQMGANLARLEVRESNAPARALYVAAGFEQIGVRKGYYACDNEAAICMSKPLRGN